MRYPNNLPKNGTIGFVAPSFGAFIEPYHSAFQNAVRKFETLGFRTDLGPNVFKGTGIGISAEPEECGKELEDYYRSPENQALISVGGGEMMCESIEQVDFRKIAEAPPKWYMGYSDNTNFTFLLPTLCDTAAVYGPNAPTFGMEPWDESLGDAMALLTGEKCTFTGYESWELNEDPTDPSPYVPYHKTEKTKYRAVDYRGPVSGRFLGGCIEVLSTLVGTKYDRVSAFNETYKEDGVIWFLEACELNSVGIERALWQMREAGWFREAKAFIIGRSGNYGDESFGLSTYEAVLREARKLREARAKETGKDSPIPVIMDADIGHLPPQIPIVSGGYGTFEIQGNPIGEDSYITFSGREFYIHYEKK